MPLHQKEYYGLRELSERWGVRKKQVKHLIETEKIQCCFWLRMTKVQKGMMVQQSDGKETFQAIDEGWVKGFVRVLAEDCYCLFRHRQVQTCLFTSDHVSSPFIKLIPQECHRIIKPKDLAILSTDVEMFEKNYDLTKHGVRSSPLAEDNFRHSSDYQTVKMNGFSFRFGYVQALIIKQLHLASLTDQPWVHGKVLLDKAGSRSEQLKNLFQGKAHWRESIESDGRGYYRLNL